MVDPAVFEKKKREIIHYFSLRFMDKTILTILGIVFIAIGLLGFFNDPLLGVFEVDTLHNIIHILSGILALGAVGMGADAMRTYSKVFGVVYGLVAVVGFLMPGDMILGLFASNLADDVLHLVLAVIFLYLGFARSTSSSPMASSM